MDIPNLRPFLIAAVLVMTTTGTLTRADVMIEITQVGQNVVATGTGTIDLTGLTNTGVIEGDPPGLQGNQAFIKEGSTSPSQSASAYAGVTGPASFGTGTFLTATTGTGDAFGPEGSFATGFLMVPMGYVSGHSLTATDTYANQTFSSLGLTPGTYTWTWGTRAHADSLTVQIGPAAAVPEPSTALVAVFGAVAFIAYGWSRHRRAQRRQAAA
jgi:hypothetical protein